MRTWHNTWVKERVSQDSRWICHTIYFAILKLERTENWKQGRQIHGTPISPRFTSVCFCSTPITAVYWWANVKATCKETELEWEHSDGCFVTLHSASYTLLICHQHHLCRPTKQQSLQQRPIYSTPAAVRANWTNVLSMSQTCSSSAHNIWLYRGQSCTQLYLI